jgi:hypothetical protein
VDQIPDISLARKPAATSGLLDGEHAFHAMTTLSVRHAQCGASYTKPDKIPRVCPAKALECFCFWRFQISRTGSLKSKPCLWPKGTAQ